jgi:hypothetical protein
MKVDPITNFDVKLIIEDPPLPPKKNTHTVTKSNIKITERDKTPNTQIHIPCFGFVQTLQ